MTLDLKAAMDQHDDPNLFVQQILNDPQRTQQMANVSTAIEQARTSDNEDLQKFAALMESGLVRAATAEQMELDAEDAAAAQDAGMWAGLGEIWNEMLGPDGKFQFTDLFNIDFGKLIGVLLGSAFNNSASVDPQAVAAERSAVDRAFSDAMAHLSAAEAGGADVRAIRAGIGGDDASHARQVADQIDKVATLPTPSADA